MKTGGGRVKIGRVFLDLLAPLDADVAIEHALAAALARLVRAAGARAGALGLRPLRAAPITVTAGVAGDGAALRGLLETAAASRRRGVPRRRPLPRGVAGSRASVLVQVPLGSGGRGLGQLVLAGDPRALRADVLSPEAARELGAILDHVWRLHRRALRARVLNTVTELGTSRQTLDEVLDVFVDGLARLVDFDAISVFLLDAGRGDLDAVDVLAQEAPGSARRRRRLPLDPALLARVLACSDPIRFDDLRADGGLPHAREALVAEGYRSLLLVPLISRGGVFGTVALAARGADAFEAADVEVLAEVVRPLASAIEQRRLLAESRRHAEELAALFRTSRLITAQLELASVLDQISRSVATLIGSSGCGIGLLDEARANLVHAAAHGFRTDAWRALSMPVGEGIIGRCAASGAPIRVDDIRTDPRSVRRDVDEQEGIRSMLCVPLKTAGATIGVISAFSTRPAVFTMHHQRVLEAFAEQAGIAIHNAQLFEESVRRARETRALLEAGRAVTASLDASRTVQVIMQQARSVLGVESCSLTTVERETGELVSVASLDLPAAMTRTIRLKVGEGIAGLAVQERRPVQSPDIGADPRVLYPSLSLASGLRSMMAVPLRVGDRAVGAISVFRRDVHRFSPREEEVLLALADQAAIALEHARLYAAQEQVVAERTRELDAQKRFVEVVLETLPLGLFVLDPRLDVVRANHEGARVVGCDGGARGRFTDLLPAGARAAVGDFLGAALADPGVSAREVEVALAGEMKILRLTAAPLGAPEEAAAHLVLLVDDVTRAKRLERQMLLTERLTTAGRLAAGVAHELNNPLATIAGCAESLLGRTREQPLAGQPEMEDFRHYLGLIEEEAYRCKEITGSLLQFVREPGSRRAPADLNVLVQKAVELLLHQSRFATRRVVTELDPGVPPAAVNEGQLRQVVLGLASNALEAMEPEGTLTIRSRLRRGEIEIEFEDEGPGIPDELLGRVFDPFFTTKPPGQGTGLGLAIAQGIVADHGGRLEVTSHPGKGSLFRVVLPA